MPQQDPIKPGQVTSLPQNNYNPNAEAGRVVNNLPNVAPPTAPNLLFDSTAPTTAEGASKVNPAYALYINTLKNANGKQAFLEQPYYTPSQVAERYSNNELGGYHPYDMNLENWYGDNQSWFKQWGNRLGKFGTKAVGSFANALMDIPNIINASAQRNLDKVWDNPVNNWATDLMEWSEKAMPNYETNWEREHPFANLIPIYGNSGNGWGKVVENLGFTVGAIGGAVAEDVIVGALTGGVGEVPLAAMQINKAVYKLGKMVNAGEDFLGALKTNIKNADDIIKGLRGVDKFNYTVRQGLWGANMITSGVSEAAFEGIESYKTLSKDLQQKYFEETGKAPSFEEHQKIDALARDAANSRFLLNAGLLAVTNSVQWGNLFRPLSATKELLEAEAKQGVQIALKKGSLDAFEAVDHASKLAKWGKKITDNAAVKLLTGSASEGFEEGAQYAIEKGVNDFYKRKYEDKNITTANNFLKSFGTGMAEAMGTKEGWENIVLGLLGGALYKGGETAYYKARGVNTNTDYKKQVDAVLDGLNSQSLTGIFENKYGPAVEAISIQEDMQAAAAKNDVFQYKNFKHDQFVNFVLSGISQNKFETRMDQLGELKKLDGAEFEKMFGIPASTENKKTVDEYVSKLEENARHMKEVHKRVSRTFINPFQYKGTGNYKNAEEKKAQDEINDKYIAYEQAKDDIIRLSSISKDSADRIKDLHSQISSLQTVVDPHTAIRLSSQDGLKDLKKEYQEKQKLADDALKLAPDAKHTRDSKWYAEKVAEIDAIVNEKDEKAQNVLYNKFLNNVFDRTQKENNKFYELYGTDPQKAAVDAPFPRDVIKDVIALGTDAYFLQKRNDVAVDRYARLTTKGGFKGLFDQIQQARKDANDLLVPLQTPQTQGQAAQQQAAFNTAQAQQGQTPTAQPQAATTNTPAQTPTSQPPTNLPQQQGYVEELGIIQTEEEERAQMITYLLEAVDGKRTLSEVEATILGFKTIDDLKFDNPSMKVEDYTMVKTQSKKNYYIPKATVEAARQFANEWNNNPTTINNKALAQLKKDRQAELDALNINMKPVNISKFQESKQGVPVRDYLQKIGMEKLFEAWIPLLEEAKVKVIENSPNLKGSVGASAPAERTYNKLGQISSVVLTVELGKDFLKRPIEQQQQILAHEFIHTVINIHKNTETTQKRKEFDSRVKQFADKIYKAWQKEKNSLGLTADEIANLDGFWAAPFTIKHAAEEIITYGLTDPLVIKMLKSMKGEKGERASLWKELLKFIENFIGIKPSAYNDLIDFIEREGIHINPELVQKGYINPNQQRMADVNAKYDALEAALNTPPPTGSGSATPTGTPQTPNTPSTPTPPTPNTPIPTPTGTGGFKSDDFLAKVYVPGDTKVAFNNAIFSGTKDQVRDGLRIVVRPLSFDLRREYDIQRANQSYTPVTGFPGIFVSKAPIDLSLYHSPNRTMAPLIGKIAYPKRMLFKVGNEFLTIDRISPQQYQQFTNNPAAQHAADVDEYNKQVAFTNLLAATFAANGNQEITLSEDDLAGLMDIKITYGELDLVPVGVERPLYNQLKHNTVTLPVTNGAPLNTMVILSAPKRQMDEDGVMVRERTGTINPIYGQNFYDNPNADDTAVLDFIASSADSIIKVNSRYIGMVSKPDGSFALVALRPAEMESPAKRDLFQTLKDRSAESIRANFVPSTKEESPKNVLLIGNDEVYYKLPSDAAKDYNKHFNETVNNSVFISDPNGKVWFEITLSPIGALRLDIHEPNSGYRNRMIIAPQKVESLDSFNAMVDAFNKELEKKEKGDDVLRGLNIRLNGSNFRQNIADDSDVANAEALASQLTAATSTEVFKNGTMRLVPNEGRVNELYKQVRASTAKAAPEQQVQAPVAPQTPPQESTNPSTPAMPKGLTSLTQQMQQPEENYNKLEDLFGPQIPSGMFAGMNATPVDQEGNIQQPQTTAPNNQEDQSKVIYNSVKEALNANDIDYRTVGDGTQFFTMSTGEILDMPGVSPKDLAASMKLNVKEQQKPKGDVGLDFMLSNENLATLNKMMNFENARTYINSILPSFIRVEDMDAVMDKIREQGIENPETDVWGAFKDGIIYLNKQAPEVGQEYHEAFHAVFNIFLSQEEQQKLLEHAKTELYKKLKKEGKSIKGYIAEQRKTGVWSNLSEGQAVNKAAEEWMAEEFRKYKNNKKSDSLLDKLFDLIERFFRWITRSQNDLNALFQKIDTGGYKYSNVAYNSFVQDTTDENTTQEFKFMLVPARPTQMAVGRGTIEVKRNLDSKTSKQVIQNVAAYFEMYKETGDFSGISDDKLLDQILDDLKATYSSTNPRYEGMTQEQLDIIDRSDENYIYSNEDTRAVIKDAAKKYINSMAYFEQFEEEELDEREQETGAPSTGYDNSSENVGGFSSLPGMLRHYLGFTSYPVQDRFGNPTLANGKPVIATIDAVSVYYGLLRATANINDPVRFFQRMIRFGDNNEQSRHFIDKFIIDSGLDTRVLFEENRIEANKNKALVEQVRKGFNKYRIDYIFTEYDMQKGKYRSYHANRKNVENVQFDNWSNRFIDGYSEMTPDQQAAVRRSIDNIRNRYFDARRATKRASTETDAIVAEVRTALLSVGIQLSFDFIKYSLLSINAKRYDALNKDYKAQGTELQFDDPQNTFISKADYNYVQVMKIADEITLNKDFMDELSRTLSSNGNPFFRKVKEPSTTEQMKDEADSDEDQVDTAMTTRITNIAKGNALFDETVGESSYMNADDKLVFAHQDGTFNVKYSYGLRDAETRRKLRETGVRNDAEPALDSYDAAWLTDNFLLKSASFEAVADNLLFQNIDGIRAVETDKNEKVITEEFRDQKEGVTYGSYSPREFLINLTNMYISYAKTQKTAAGDVITTPHLIRVLEASKTANTVNLPINLDVYREGTVTEKTLDIMLNEVQKEFNRIARVQGEVGTLTDNIVENYHTGSFAEDGFTVTKGFRGLKFTDNMTSLISKSTANLLERKARTGQEMSQEDIASIKQEIKNSLNKMVEDAIDLMVAEGVIKLGPKGLSYQNVLLHRHFFVGNKDLNLQSVDKGIKFKTNIGHVLINDYINTFAYNQILHGDAALSLKNDGGIDAVKRAKGDNAAITSIRTDLVATDLGITEAFTHSKVAIFKEPIAVDGTKVADAQMYTTIKGLRYTLWGLGRLSPRLARFLDALERGDDIHSLVDAEGKPFDGVFDDDKGLLAWHEMTNSLKLVFKDGKTYYKMSVVVLQPSLTARKNEQGEWETIPGWETLDNLRRKMEADGVHFAAPESASKMMTLDVSRAKDFSDLKGHLVDNQYFGLQTENPSNKLEITTPTQLLQLIDSEQVDGTDVYFQGTKTTIGEVRKAYQDAVSQKVSNSFDSALNDIYDISEFNEDMDKLIVEGKVSPRLSKFYKRVSSTLEASGSDAQLLDFFSLDENGNIKFNANLSAIKTKSQQLYLSYFSKGVLSQKNPGYTVALFSGIDTKTPRIAKKVVNGVVTEWEYVRRDQWDANHNDVRNKQVLGSRDQVTEEGQLFLDELQHMTPQYNEDGEVIGHYSEMMLPAHFAELLGLQSGDEIPEAIAWMFGVRIPSQDKHSFISLRLIDFLPANLGSTGMFPKEIVKLSGADFDIDKVFITRYDFYMKKDKNGKTTYHKYGEATGDRAKWAEYKRWMLENNKSLKNTVRDILLQDSTYQSLKDEQEVLRELQMEEVFDDAAKQLKKELYDRAVSQALAQLKLPSNQEEFTEASKTRELNNGVLNNRILDSYRTLLTNTSMHDIANTPASLDALADIQDNDDITLKDANGNKIGSVFQKKTNYPVDSLMGKFYGFKNNTTGKNNIGIDVNANLIYSVANKGEIILEQPEDENAKPNGFIFDNHHFASFAGNREYNPETQTYDGKRTNDVLSTLITAATDEAKEQLNALYNLGVDALKVVNYLVALKVPLKTAIYFVNQPSIRNYLDIKAVKQNTIQTKEEENLYRDAFRMEALLKTQKQIKDYKDMSDNELFGMFEANGLVEVRC
jgi:hypothetical protein